MYSLIYLSKVEKLLCQLLPIDGYSIEGFLCIQSHQIGIVHTLAVHHGEGTGSRQWLIRHMRRSESNRQSDGRCYGGSSYTPQDTS